MNWHWKKLGDVVQPAPPDRCATKDCPRGGLWRPVLCLYPVGRPTFHAPIRAGMGLLVCAPCRDATTVEDLVTDAGWEKILGAIRGAGKADPDRETILLEWERPEEMAWLDGHAKENA